MKNSPVRSRLASLGAHDLAVVAVALEAGLDLLRWVDPALVPDDLEYRVIERLGGWEPPDGST